MSSPPDDEDDEQFTFEQYINLIRDQSSDNLCDDNLATWGSLSAATSTCTSATNSTCNSTSSSKAGGRVSSSPPLETEEETLDPVERRIQVKQHMEEEVRESELDSKERLEVNDKIEPQLPPSNAIHSYKERKRHKKKMRRKSIETLTLLGNSVSSNTNYTVK